MDDWQSAFTEKEYDAIILGTGFKVIVENELDVFPLGASLRDCDSVTSNLLFPNFPPGMLAQWHSRS